MLKLRLRRRDRPGHVRPSSTRLNRPSAATILALSVAYAGLIGTPHGARGDEGSGTWTAELEARGNAFYERSSRVVVPQLGVVATSPSGLRLGASYLVDVISSASIAQGGTDQDKVFTELRHGVDAKLGGELELGKTQLELNGSGTYSTENDYRSFNAGIEALLSLHERTTKLRLSATHVRDTISSNLDPSFTGSLRGVTLGTGLEQIINPWLVLHVGYAFGYLEGFLANPYRRALVGPLPFPETHPHERLRHNATAALLFYVPSSDTAVHLMYRAYVDSWDIAALTPELRIYQHFGEHFLVRVHYRYYTQTRAFFFRRSYPQGWRGYVTNDPKMTALHTHTAGLSLELRLPFLERTWVDFAIERYVSTSVYGDGVLATTGLRMGF